MTITVDELVAIKRVLDEAYVEPKGRSIWCPYCDDWHSEERPASAGCRLFESLEESQ